MAIIEKVPGKMKVDLTGPDGNVFYLIGLARKLSRLLDLDSKEIVKEMMASDYNNAIQVFDGYFGDLVDLEC